ncbi:mannosyltransferase [Legionella massiliensis]|uniref:Mannosyltransferase n=1 Tax=Legionella massiliensis TaxID=1034943 RepID=A0A078KU84_9GAMM|nr:glycosyltransferase family 87 protein [Legionella massiliensis]CDZ78005.1 mannosyltransferase [Legionella massiliensis]CEE13743.1 hypothetical protein BN1094_02302 [Legionella massiliensis]
MNNKKTFRFVIPGALIFVYAVVLFLIFNLERTIDFTPFYISIKALSLGFNPYPLSKTLPANLNPPIFLYVFYPLGFFEYRTAIIIWSLISISLGFIGIRLMFMHIFSEKFRQKYGLSLYCIYFGFFPILMDISIVQVGSLLLFAVMLGYHYYLRQNDYIAGICWGFIISLKLFPALLFFFMLKQRRYKVFFITLGVFLCALLIPLLFHGPTIYKQYLTMMSVIYWYGDSWNASIYGYIFRLYLDLKHPGQNVVPVYIGYLISFAILLPCYLYAMGPKEIRGEKNQVNYQPFCLTLAMMIFLSPFGWLYYFPLIVFPLMLTGIATFNRNYKTLIPLIAWTACFLLLNFPQGYILGRQMQNFTQKIGLYSFSFYGLAILVILVCCKRNLPGQNEPNISLMLQNEDKRRFLLINLASLAFGIAAPLNSFLIRLSMGGAGSYNLKDLYPLLGQS